MQRKAYQSLAEWRGRKHKCLLVKGQRQVGKTYLVTIFGQTYKNFINIPLDKQSNRSLFEGCDSVDDVISSIKVRFRDVNVVPGETLIFLDEIQECPKARAFLKDFSIDGRYDVIASGSLLGIEDTGDRPSDEESHNLIPVGYEEHLTMRSLDFEEFLWAYGMPPESIESVRMCVHDRKPLPKSVLDEFDKAFRHFCIVGGMPESVQAFIDTGDYEASLRISANLVSSCRSDIIRYCKSGQAVKTLECFDSIPAQLADTNKKFMYSRVDGGGSRGSSEKYSENLNWIKNAGYGIFVYGLTEISRNIVVCRIPDLFKVYMSDTGLLVRMYSNEDEEVLEAIFEGDSSYNFGAVAENIVAECIVKCGIVPRFYRKTNGANRMEIDFVAKIGRDLAVIEVKSGRSRSSPSLDVVDKRFKVDRKIKLENSNIGVYEDGTEHYPLFAAAFMDSMKRRYCKRFQPAITFI